jgi:hypothetical protein
MPPRSARLAQIEARLAGLVPQPDAHQSRLAACSRQDDQGVDSNLSELRIGQREQRTIAAYGLNLKRRRAGIHVCVAATGTELNVADNPRAVERTLSFDRTTSNAGASGAKLTTRIAALDGITP